MSESGRAVAGTADSDWLYGAEEATVDDNVQAAAEGERRISAGSDSALQLPGHFAWER